MFGNVIIFILLFASWYVFSGESGLFFIIAGAFSSLAGVYVAARTGLAGRLGIKPGIFRYWLWLAGEVIKSSIGVTKCIWGLKPVKPIFREITTIQNSDLGYTVFGNSITLTPGTVTVDIDEGIIIVHALNESDLESLAEMDRKVKGAVK